MSNIIDSIQLSGVTYQIQGSGGGGKAIEAGRGIAITTGETADTVSFDLPISAGTASNSIVEGAYTTASGNSSHAEGYNTKANGEYSHTEGISTTASGSSSHAEGNNTTASGSSSHAEGERTTASGDYSHAEGYYTQASGVSSHAEGFYTTANGNQSHAEGNNTTASGNYSHVEGYQTKANNQSEHASGQYNVSSSASTTFGDSGNTLFSVGNGTAANVRHNAFEIRQNGDIYLSSGGTDIKLQDHLGGGGGNPTVELTQAEYDALVTAGTVAQDTYYIITDAQAGDLTNYYTKSETNALLGGKADTATTYTKTEVDTALSGKADTATTYTKTEVDNAITAATSTKQDTLVSGTNIKTINNTSILGSGNIDIQGGGGGKAIEAGRGIAITTGETADTVSFDLPIYKTVSGTAYSLVLNAYSEPSANTFKTNYNTYINCINPYVDNSSGARNLIMGEACSAMSYTSESFVGGFNSKIGDIRTFAFGARSEALAVGAVAFGYDGQNFKPQVSKGNGSFACGGGTSANTAYSFATGYHNFTTRRSEFASGQYNNSVSASTTFGDSGNTLFSVGNGTADNARHNAFEIRQNGDIYLNNGTSDVKLQEYLQIKAVKISQSDYDALVQGGTVDANTLYIITNVVS